MSTYITIGQPNSPLRVILEIEDDTRVIAVLRPNGAVMEYRDVPSWVLQQIRDRGMVYIGGALVDTTFPQPSTPQQKEHKPFGWTDACKYALYFIIGMFVVAIVVGIIDSFDEGDASVSVASSPTATPTPVFTWYAPAEITAVYQSNIARANVLFQSGTIGIRGKVAELHPTNPRIVYLVERDATDWMYRIGETAEQEAARDWRVIRVELPVSQVAMLNLGDAISVRCDGLKQDRYVDTGAELECLEPSVVG